jgi:N-methylhydantoinase A
VPGPAVVTTPTTTYLVEPGWRIETGAHGAIWFLASSSLASSSLASSALASSREQEARR